MFDFLKKVFGTKSEKDIRGLESKVAEINSIYDSLKNLSNDELRSRSSALKASIHGAVTEQAGRINTIKTAIAANPDMDVNEKEENYKQIDDIEKEIADEFEKVLG